MNDEARKYLEGMLQRRGYIAEEHRQLAEADLDWLKAYDAFVQTTYIKPRLLDRRTKELLQTAVMVALGAPAERVEPHMRIALEHGVSPEELLETLQVVIMPMGAAAFLAGFKIWVDVTAAHARR